MSWTWFPGSDVCTMGRPCISLKSIRRKGIFACGDARNATGGAGKSGYHGEKRGGSLSPRHRPYTKFWNDPRDELMWPGPFSQRRQKLHTDSKPVVFHALTINDACLGTE